jgi:hypothetical protein
MKSIIQSILSLFSSKQDSQSLSTALIDMAKDEGIEAMSSQLTDWHVCLDDMMENCSKKSIRAISVLRNELSIADQYVLARLQKTTAYDCPKCGVRSCIPLTKTELETVVRYHAKHFHNGIVPIGTRLIGWME